MTQSTDPILDSSPSRLAATVTYAIPIRGVLKTRFPSFVNDDIPKTTFRPIEMCRHVSCEPGELVFEYMVTKSVSDQASILAKMHEEGLRPALAEELVSFLENHPQELGSDTLVALGSRGKVLGRFEDFCLFAWRNPKGACIGLAAYDADWRGDSYRFLAVREAARTS